MSEFGVAPQDVTTEACCACEPVDVEHAPVVEEIAPAPMVEEIAPAPAEEYVAPAPAEEVVPAPVAEETVPAPLPVETYAPAPAGETQAAPAIETQPATPAADSSAPAQSLVIHPAPMEAQAAPGPGAPVELADLLAPEAQQSASSAPLVITSDQSAVPAPVNLSDFPIFRTNPDGGQSLAVQPVAPAYNPLGVPSPGRSGAYTWSLPQGWYYGYRH